MAKVLVIGVAGEDGLYLADLDAGTISKIPAPTKGALASADQLRASGVVITKGVNLAVTAQSTASVSGGFMDG
jgi:hypothetical protein